MNKRFKRINANVDDMGIIIRIYVHRQNGSAVYDVGTRNYRRIIGAIINDRHNMTLTPAVEYFYGMSGKPMQIKA